MPKALIIYTTRSGQTKKIANFVAEGMQLCGVETTVATVSEVEKASDLEGYDALVIGSPTYHGEMMKSVRALLGKTEKASVDGRVGGAFGAYGWSGEAPGQILDTMKNIFKMDTVSGSVKLKSALLTDSEQIAEDYGRDIAKKIGR